MKRIIIVFLILLSVTPIVYADTALIYSSNDANMYANAHTSWTNLRNHAGTSVADNPVGPNCVKTIAHATPETDVYTFIYRCGISWNTTPIEGGTIDSVVVRLKFFSKTTTLSGQNETAIVAGSPENPADYVAGDYDALDLATPTELAPRFDFTSTTAGNINFTLNAAGLSAINETGTTVFYFLDGDEIDNSFSGTWVADAVRMLRVYGTADASEANRPYLLIEYTPSDGGDTTPPASITGLTNTTYNCGNISWSWTNPVDADFNHTYVLKNNVWIANYTNVTTTALWDSLTDNTEYIFSSKTVDITGNINNTWVNASSTTKDCATPPDTTPPASITGLTNTSYNCDSISWAWSKPLDADFNYLYVLKNNVWIANYSNATTTALWEGLTNNTEYIFSSKTVDITGNINSTWVNASSTTANECITPTPNKCEFYNLSINSTLQTANSIKWEWDLSDDITSVSVDGWNLTNVDYNSSVYILNNLRPDTKHIINIYNTTDCGQNITYTLSETIAQSEQELFFETVTVYLIFILALICCIIGAFFPPVGLGACLFSIIGLSQSVNSSLIMVILFTLTLIVGIVECLTIWQEV